MTINHTEYAFALGSMFAAYLNERHDDAQARRLLASVGDIPDYDYFTLKTELGDVTPEIEEAYRDGFNCTLETVGSPAQSQPGYALRPPSDTA